jgi:hypothetical protein
MLHILDQILDMQYLSSPNPIGKHRYDIYACRWEMNLQPPSGVKHLPIHCTFLQIAWMHGRASTFVELSNLMLSFLRPLFFLLQAFTARYGPVSPVLMDALVAARLDDEEGVGTA